MHPLLNFCKYVPHALPKREKTHRGSTSYLTGCLADCLYTLSWGLLPVLKPLAKPE